MDFTSINGYLFTLIVALGVYFIVKQILFARRLPPGPWGLPFIGYLLTLNRKNPIQEFSKLKERYGKIFSVNCGDFLLIVVHDFKIVSELAKKDEFCGRPDFEVWKMRNQGKKNRGILFADNYENWSEQRRFALRNLRDFGFGKQSMETMFISELQQLTSHLKESLGKPTNVAESFNASVLNSLWTILTGKRFAQDDPFFNKLMQLTHMISRTNILVNPASFYPWPAKYNIVKRGVWKSRNVFYSALLDEINAIILEHKASLDENDPRDFIDVYLQHMNNGQHGKSFEGEEGIKNLQIVMFDLFIAGVETTSTTILFAVLFFSKFPEVQKKLHEEIDRIIGRDRMPTRDDKAKMIYMEAFCNEVHRKASLLPMSVFHKVNKDTVYDGMLFPEGSVIFLNLRDVHHSEETWEDPEDFRPERFLDDSGTKLVKREDLIPFGTGKRLCLGESLARDNLFFFITGLLQELSFELESSCKDIDINDFRPNFTSSPYPFEVIIALRT